MRERPTTRVLLIDPAGRLLLMRYKDFADPDAPPFWATIGGGREDGESVEACAQRETFEETGITHARLGPIVWYGEWVLKDAYGEERLFREHYIVAHAPTAELSFENWTELEREMLIAARWFTFAELQALRERHYPTRLAELIAPVLRGEFPAEVVMLERED